MLKKILIFFVLSVSILAYLIYDKVQTGPNSPIPYPYQFSAIRPTMAPLQSPLLIVGDRMAIRFAKFIPLLQEELSQGLSKKIEIESWAAPREGLHRTIEKLKSLEKLPKIIIYLGGTEEWAEEKYIQSSIPNILSNMDRYKDPMNRTILMVAPWMASLIYKPYAIKSLSGEVVLNEHSSDEQVLRGNELNYRLYELEIGEFIQFVKSRGSLPIIITSPHNLDAPPKKNCDGSILPEFEPAMEEARKHFNEGDFKSVVVGLKGMVGALQSSADFYFLLGQAQKRLGEFADAKKNLQLANIYDCQPWRGSIIYNSIQKKMAAQYGIYIYDLDQLLLDNWNDNIVFTDEIFPQNLYFEQMASAMGKMLRKILKL